MISKTMLCGSAMPLLQTDNTIPSPARHPCSDNRLLALAQTDDKKAFTEIYRCYAKKLIRYVQNQGEAPPLGEEIVQEIFAWLWLKRHTLQQVSSLQAYLFQATRFRYLNHLRTEKVKREFTDHHIYAGTRHDNSLHEWIDLNHLQAAIDRSIRQLPHKCQTAFRLSRHDNMPIPHIAQQMNISSRTVENYITRALQHLRSTLHLRRKPP